MLLYLDTETYSPYDLKTYGTYKYAEKAEIIMWQYAIDDGPVVVTEGLTSELSAFLKDKSYTKVIHNSSFDRTLIRYVTGIDIPVEDIIDTMVMAQRCGLPGGLGELCSILGVSEDKAKSKEGKRLVMLFCKDHKRKDGHVYRNTKGTHPAEWKQFCEEYGRLDVEAMREVYKRLPKWTVPMFEQVLWLLDQRINDRGIYVDQPLATAAIDAISKAKSGHEAFTNEKTGGRVTSTNQRQALLEYINDTYKLTVEDLKSATVRDMLKEDLPPDLIDLLETRLDASKTSAAKYRRVLNCVNSDGRIRGLFKYYGAVRTGRWAGRLFQPQNLPRPTIDDELLDTEIELILDGNVPAAHSTMEVCSSAIRRVLRAASGNKFVISDLSNIEGRVLPWLAGEESKLQVFREYDAGIGPDIYNAAYAKAFGTRVEDANPDTRQIGKVMELAFGFQGGIGAWVNFATVFGIDLEALALKAWGSIPPETKYDSTGFVKWMHENKLSTYGLSDTALTVCNSFKQLWRDAHPNIVQYWKLLDTRVRQAIDNRGHNIECLKHTIRADKDWLRIKLPSGRCLVYAQPAIVDGKISYMGVNQFNHKWSRIFTFGGKLCENTTQAVARDILGCGVIGAEAVGYPVVLTAHDEIVAEVPDKKSFTYKDLETIMSKGADWCTDLPLSAKGFETYFYTK